jgi:hypothetical protein
MSNLTVTRNKGEINPLGGDIFKVKEVTEDNAELSTPDTPHDLGEIKEFTLITKPTYEEIKNVLGKTVKKYKTDEVIGFDAVLLQSASAVLNIAIECNEKWYQGYHYNGIVDGRYQEIFWAGGNLGLKSGEIKYKGGEVDVTFVALPNDTAVTMTPSAWSAYCGSGSLSASATVTIPAKQGWTMVETSVTAV